MRERSRLIEYLRGEIVGPSRPLLQPEVIEFQGGIFRDRDTARRGPLAWRPAPGAALEEVLFYDRESPFRKYGAGQLHPQGAISRLSAEEAAALAADTVGADLSTAELEEGPDSGVAGAELLGGGESQDSDFDITSPDVLRPSTIGISCCARIPESASLVVRLPGSRRFSWQEPDSEPFPVNGRYEKCKRVVDGAAPERAEHPIWRRHPAVDGTAEVVLPGSALRSGRPVAVSVPLPAGSPLVLHVEAYARALANGADRFIVTVVLRNRGPADSRESAQAATLFQVYFEVLVDGGELVEYPESERPFSTLDPEEQSLRLLYRDSATWAIGHGCAAGWDAAPGRRPEFVYADVMPAVETPSMTPDIQDGDGRPIRLRMRDLAELADDGTGSAWSALRALAAEYERWIRLRREDLRALPAELQPVGDRHLALCEDSLDRIRHGIELLERDSLVRRAFRLANLAMLLQQIATKQLKRRPARWDAAARMVRPEGPAVTPWTVYQEKSEAGDLGAWRAFQIAFLLMQLEGVSRPESSERAVVDLIWFPTGGGKTEAYLGVMAFYMFHQRLLMASPQEPLPRDGTNVLMRYTLRMLTTQQFQRAASLVAAMEFLRRNPEHHGNGEIPGRRFAVGLWIGGDGTPNTVENARSEVRAFRQQRIAGNPLVLTECPWCRAEIGRCTVPGERQLRLVGILDSPDQGPRLLCPDPDCAFGAEHPDRWLPVEVIDERIYATRPSLVIATADKLAMVAFRPEAGVLFGRIRQSDLAEQVAVPPGLIVQDELHLIAGPLGTIYALYEGIFERLCTLETDGHPVCPKIIASTATIRGAGDQVRALYARIDPEDGSPAVRLFPSPGLSMGDSFFGTYARRGDGTLEHGRLYLGVHAAEYGSVLTAQVRAFSAALCAPVSFAPEQRDPWWTLLTFYNSIRELGGARTLFDSDIRSRLKFLQNRERIPDGQRRLLRVVEELTSRLSQAEIVAMMDMLAVKYNPEGPAALDACLASSIIEVGVDIDRLSLMGVVGQPKTTAQYIQVTGRVGRRWWERPGLILMIYNPAKSRDRSHFEQFYAYHRRLYEQVEPTSATPFAVTAIQRAFCGALILWARQHSTAEVWKFEAYKQAVEEGFELLKERCRLVLGEDAEDSIGAMKRMRDQLIAKWRANPQLFEDFPPAPDGEYLMLWPGQYASRIQLERGVVVPSSMRQVDASAELAITQAYARLND